jgi:hypothetical protein
MALDATAGGENSNSYVIVAEADAYFAMRLNSATFDDSDLKEEALLHACLLLEQLDYIGIPVTDTPEEDGYNDAPPFQALKWPRVTENGELIRNYGGTKQVETATVIGTITGSGNATVTVTADGLTGSPIALSVAVLELDTASDVATKIRTALNTDSDITDFFIVGGTGAAITLTAKTEAANDATMNLAYDNDTCTGLTGNPTSVDTTPGALYAVPTPIKYAQCEVALWLLQTGSDAGGVSGSEQLLGVDLGPIKLKYGAGDSGGASTDLSGLPIQAARFLKGLRLYAIAA